MKLVIFGLTVSSSWGNGHATLWRGLIRALGARGHDVHFFERDVPYYAAHRDLTVLPGGTLHLYSDWPSVRPLAQRLLRDADVAMVTSYCADALTATSLVLESAARLRTFYDLDSGVTLTRLAAGAPVDYVGPDGYRHFDLVLSYTGGKALEQLGTRLGAPAVAPLYGSVDPLVHRRVPPIAEYRCDLSYLGTYAADRQAAVEALFVEPARRSPGRRFVLAGSQYPVDFPWTENLFYVAHLPPGDHPGFYCSARLGLNVTRASMAAMGYCPSGRLFEAAACGAPLVTDEWEGLEHFFTPGEEVLVARSTDDVVAAMELSDGELDRIGEAGRERTLRDHTAERRALDLERLLDGAVAAPAAPEPLDSYAVA